MERYILKTKPLKTKAEAQAAGFKLFQDAFKNAKKEELKLAVNKVDVIEANKKYTAEIILFKE